jgi:hypothetical protein
VQFQCTPFALDLFDLVVEDLLGLLRVFEPRLYLTLARLRSVGCRFDAPAQPRKLTLCRFRSPTRMSELLPELLSLGIRPLSALCFVRSLRLRLDERLRKRVDVRRKQRESPSKIRLMHELQLFGLRRDSPAVATDKRASRRPGSAFEVVIDL